MWPEIVCPLDYQRLQPSSEGLRCPNQHTWPILSGIPRMLEQDSNYADCFGHQWNAFRRTQLDSHTGTTITSDRARRILGPECLGKLESDQRVEVLEVGCGAGRFTEFLLSTPAAHVTSVDFSSAVEANQANFPQGDRHRVVQGDVRQLPFLPGQFDLVFCVGVVQHTPDPEQTIRSLLQQVRPGGWLVFDHYAAKISYFASPSWVLRPILKRLSPERSLAWTKRLVDTLLPIHRLTARIPVVGWLLPKFSPVVTYHRAYGALSDALQYEWSLLDTYDGLTDWYKHLRTKGQIERYLAKSGASSVACRYGGNGIEARCRRPQTAESHCGRTDS